MRFTTSTMDLMPLQASQPFDPSKYRYTGPNVQPRQLPNTRSQAPITTGTSVIGLQFDGGVMIAADKLGSYGSLARYQNIGRLMRVNDHVILGCTGDYADFQFLRDIIDQKMIDEECLDDGIVTRAPALHCWLTRVLYNRRSRFDPLWTTFVVGGLDDDGKPFLGFVDKLGTAYTAPQIVSGMGGHLATPLLREKMDGQPPLSEAAARELLIRCMTVCYYRDCRAFSKFQIATLKAGSIKIEDDLEVKGDWEVAHFSKEHA
ncbi:Proteasome subunit beta type-4 [Amphibalanus amphitrite]|uniref:Proteasome subunit beta n=1 Tax=Amphibalanus amphitrite TaxID=1232801 RepID=A0A6A4VWT7_AMPAM|nr:Proteasome subunit beta type-4 [Amphibalanus amphitrite]